MQQTYLTFKNVSPTEAGFSSSRIGYLHFLKAPYMFMMLTKSHLVYHVLWNLPTYPIFLGQGIFLTLCFCHLPLHLPLALISFPGGHTLPPRTRGLSTPYFPNGGEGVGWERSQRCSGQRGYTPKWM